jgi:hypothetical protein
MAIMRAIYTHAMAWPLRLSNSSTRSAKVIKIEGCIVFSKVEINKKAALVSQCDIGAA